MNCAKKEGRDSVEIPKILNLAIRRHAAGKKISPSAFTELVQEGFITPEGEVTSKGRRYLVFKSGGVE